MYKGASRFGQSLRQSGRGPTGQRKIKKSVRKKTKTHRKYDDIGNRIKLQQWATYFRECQKAGTNPVIPSEVLKKLKDEKLIC